MSWNVPLSLEINSSRNFLKKAIIDRLISSAAVITCLKIVKKVEQLVIFSFPLWSDELLIAVV